MNYSKEVLKRILTDTKVDMEEAAIKIAIENPSVFLKALNPEEGEENGLGDKMIQHIKNDQKILAIKDLRAVTGLGLKYTKHMIDALQDCMRSEGALF